MSGLDDGWEWLNDHDCFPNHNWKEFPDVRPEEGFSQWIQTKEKPDDDRQLELWLYDGESGGRTFFYRNRWRVQFYTNPVCRILEYPEDAMKYIEQIAEISPSAARYWRERYEELKKELDRKK